MLLVGLGNPGPRYARNRHNVGFMAVDAIHRHHSFAGERSRFSALIAEGKIAGRRVVTLKPLTFMNESGRAVGEAVRFFKMPLDHVVVMYDEIDLALGKVRAKQGGGHAGHNGLRNLVAHLGPEFWRIRIGIGHPGDKDKVHGYVLNDFAKAEWPIVEKILDAVAAEAAEIAKGDMNTFMSRVAMHIQPQRPKPPRRSDQGSDTPPTSENET